MLPKHRMKIILILTERRNNIIMKDNSKISIKGIKYIISLIFKYYFIAIILVFLGIIFQALSTVFGTMFIQSLIDNYILPLLNNNDHNFIPLFNAIIKIAYIYMMGIAASFLYNLIMVRINHGTMKRVRKDLFSHMEKLPIKYFDTHAHGDIMSVYTNDTDTLRQFIGVSLPQFISSVITVISVFIGMCILSFPLAIVSALMSFIMINISSRVGKSSAKYFALQQSSLGKTNAYIEEMLGGQKVIKVFCHEKTAIEDFKKINNELRENACKANSFANILMPIVAQLGNFGYVVCAIVGSLFAVKGLFGISVGTIVAFMSLVRSFNQPFMQMGHQIHSIIMAFAGADRIYELLQAKAEEDDGYIELVNIDDDFNETAERTGSWAWKDINTGEYKRVEGEIIFENVDFGYDFGKAILHDISLYAKKGQKIAFVGSTGAGKTTITNLLNRFYEIDSGEIRYDGIKIKEIQKRALRKSLGIVLQETRIFTGSIMDNIRYGRLDATDEECINAAKLANAHSFIERLPNAYDTVIKSDTDSLSQGQLQLLAIARAAVANPPVLILDEATSSIDTRTEKLVQKGMDSLMKGRTTFVIAHRLSTIQNADCIMVLENGRIIERGSHKELISLGGRYSGLYKGIAGA